MKARLLGVALHGDRNQCTGCDRLFNSTRAFDRHRAGEHAQGRRRCLTPDEMLARGMVLGADGFWRGEAMSEAARMARGGIVAGGTHG